MAKEITIGDNYFVAAFSIRDNDWEIEPRREDKAKTLCITEATFKEMCEIAQAANGTFFWALKLPKDYPIENAYSDAELENGVPRVVRNWRSYLLEGNERQDKFVRMGEALGLHDDGGYFVVLSHQPKVIDALAGKYSQAT